MYQITLLYCFLYATVLQPIMQLTTRCICGRIDVFPRMYLRGEIRKSRQTSQRTDHLVGFDTGHQALSTRDVSSAIPKCRSI